MKNVTIITSLYLISNNVISILFIQLATFSPSSATKFLRDRRRRTTTNDNDDNNIVHIPLIPHHVQQERRQRRRQLKENNNIQLHHGKGTHYIDLWIGTPAQLQTVIVDTGSSITALPCSDCIDCGREKQQQQNFHMDNYFLQQQSTTFHDDISCDECLFGSCNNNNPKNNKCIRTEKYIEGSEWTAEEVFDIISTSNSSSKQNNNNNSFQLHFGCQSRVTGFFQTQLADGVMGMDKNLKSSFWKQAYDQKVVSNQAFSLCFSGSEEEDNSAATGAGVMTLGGTDPKLHETTMVYADQVDYNNNNQNQISKISHYYNIRIKKIYFRSYQGGTSVQQQPRQQPNESSIILPVEIDETTLNNGSGSGGIILDSGSTETYFPAALEGPFKETFKTLTGTHKDWYDALTPDEYAVLPTLLIQLQGSNTNNNSDATAAGLATNVIGDDNDNNANDIIVAMPPSHYMIYSPRDQRYTTTIQFRKDPLGILGANFMMGHNIHFDNDRNRIGFAESHCTLQQFEES